MQYEKDVFHDKWMEERSLVGRQVAEERGMAGGYQMGTSCET